MKKYYFLGGLLLLLIICWGMGQSAWHLERNRLNVLPKGKLVATAKKQFKDADGRIWELQPQIKNKFHQPDAPAQLTENPYEKVVSGLAFNPQTPNWKLLSRTEDGGSHEAILQPNGKYLTTGPKRGTYNYGHPDGLVGMVKHAIYDVIPHFFNTHYEN
jgi:hypothetical protein